MDPSTHFAVRHRPRIANKMPCAKLIPFTIAQVESEFKVEKKVDSTEVMVWQPKGVADMSVNNDFDISLVGHFTPLASSSDASTQTSNMTQQLHDFVQHQQKQSPKDIFFRLTAKFGNATPNPSVLVCLTDICGGSGTCLSCKTLAAVKSVSPSTETSTCLRLVGFVKPIKASNGSVLANFVIARSARVVSAEAKTVQSITVSMLRKQMFKSGGGGGMSTLKTSTPTIKKAQSWNDNFNFEGDEYIVADLALKFCQANPSSDGVSKAFLLEKSKLDENMVDAILVKLGESGLLYGTIDDHYATTI
jgi:hypothetical protein